MNTLITRFPRKPTPNEIPSVIPSPFANSPHTLAKQACLVLQQRLKTETALAQFLATGKMFGVLVVRDQEGDIGFLSAFSGMMNGLWLVPGFAPPIFDLTEHHRLLLAARETSKILDKRLHALEESLQQSDLEQQISALLKQRDLIMAELKRQHNIAKTQRKQQRQALIELIDTNKQETRMAALALESQRQKRAFQNTRHYWNEKLKLLQQPLDKLTQQIAHIKQTYADNSRQLHAKVFATYRLKNQLNEQQPITHFFNDDRRPSAGTGDCAGPKLIHYAHTSHLQPLALAEFWWGPPLSSAGIRHHGHYYPACRGKCRPIIPFMLRGLNVEPEPEYGQGIAADEPQTVYEDEHLLVVNKPAGLMSVPGNRVKDSVYTRLQQRYPKLTELRLVHRLDMGTSGLLLVAKNLRTNKLLQKQFIQRSVEKRYEALLSKRLAPELLEGDIALPLRVDIDDRPRQQVCLEHGKTATTHWQVIGHEGETTRIWFYPLTGRTHQLRVHASHTDGLNTAIVGDALYGQAGERLMLHAQRLCFTHPVTHERMEYEVPAPF